MALTSLNKDLLNIIKSYLNNNDILQLIICSKDLYQTIGSTDTFTSITINQRVDICDMIRFYLKNKRSIHTTTIINIKEPASLWPFGTNTMIFINCDDPKYIEQNYKCKNLTVINKKYSKPKYFQSYF